MKVKEEECTTHWDCWKQPATFGEEGHNLLSHKGQPVLVVTTTGYENVWQTGWQLGGGFCHHADLPSSCKAGKSHKPFFIQNGVQAKKMTGQSQSKAGQGNWVPSGVENGLDSFKRVKNPKSAFFRSTIPVLIQRHRQHKAAWIHRWFTPNQLLASVLKKTLKLSVSLCFIICFLPISSESIPALIGDSAIENLLIQIPPSSAESQWEEGRKKPNSTFYFSPFK